MDDARPPVLRGFGGVAAVGPDGPVDLGGPKQRAVLALLAARPGRRGHRSTASSTGSGATHRRRGPRCRCGVRVEPAQGAGRGRVRRRPGDRVPRPRLRPAGAAGGRRPPPVRRPRRRRPPPRAPRRRARRPPAARPGPRPARRAAARGDRRGARARRGHRPLRGAAGRGRRGARRCPPRASASTPSSRPCWRRRSPASPTASGCGPSWPSRSTGPAGRSRRCGRSTRPAGCCATTSVSTRARSCATSRRRSSPTTPTRWPGSHRRSTTAPRPPPRPPRRRSSSTKPRFGRAAEEAQGRALLDRLPTRGGVLVVSGEAGHRQVDAAARASAPRRGAGASSSAGTAARSRPPRAPVPVVAVGRGGRCCPASELHADVDRGPEQEAAGALLATHLGELDRLRARTEPARRGDRRPPVGRRRHPVAARVPRSRAGTAAHPPRRRRPPVRRRRARPGRPRLPGRAGPHHRAGPPHADGAGARRPSPTWVRARSPGGTPAPALVAQLARRPPAATRSTCASCWRCSTPTVASPATADGRPRPASPTPCRTWCAAATSRLPPGHPGPADGGGGHRPPLRPRRPRRRRRARRRRGARPARAGARRRPRRADDGRRRPVRVLPRAGVGHARGRAERGAPGRRCTPASPT